MVVVETEPHTAGVLAALVATGRPIGDAKKPAGGEPPYTVVYPGSGTRGGTIADPDADAALLYRIICVGWDRTGAQWMADRVAEAMRSVVVPGRTVMRITLENDVGVDRDDDVAPALFVASPLWRVWTTP